MSEQTDATHPDEVSAEQRQALDVVARMIDAGIPVFAAPPCPAAHGGECSRPGHNGIEEYDLPSKWQKTVPSKVWLERWQPGWALAAIGGKVADWIDNDPRNGGDASMAELTAAGHMPRVYGVAETPSGGQHFTIAPLGERKGELMPGVDYQGGTAEGEGLGFVWLAPTVRRSKNMDHLGERRPYRWLQEPDLDWLTEGGDETGEMLRSRLHAARARKNAPRVDDRTERLFTEAEARAFCTPILERLGAAQIGQIEERANNAAVQLSHFVPEIWDAEFAYNALMGALSKTAYDPNHAAASWTADKFRAVIAGENGRAPGDWKAQPKRTAEEAVAAVQPDAVEALLAEMLTPEQLEEMPPPVPLIEGLLNLDSEAWIIGPPGSKKSFVALDMAGAISTGRQWQERDVTQGAVVMIVAEGSAGIGKRIKAYRAVHGRMGAVHVLPRPVQAKDAGAWAVLVKACERLKPVMVVVDTQHRVTVGLEENSATDMGYYIQAVGAIRKATGACVLTVHHTGRKGGDARGSSALDGAQDTELSLEPDSGNNLRVVIKTSKQKDLEEGAPMKLAFRVEKVGVDAKGGAVTSLAVLAPDAWMSAEADAVEQEDWELHWPAVARQIIRVLAEQGGEIGLTEAAARDHVAGRFYGGRCIRSGPKGDPALRRSTFATAWRQIHEARNDAGDPIISAVGGARWALDPIASKGYAPSPV